jgi:hypothetical protein
VLKPNKVMAFVLAACVAFPCLAITNEQAAKQGQGEWNPSPEDPFLPSPDGKSEYHFVAPYLEFHLPASAAYPYLLAQAQRAFASDPTKTAVFVTMPLSGKMKNGKLAAVSALVCIKNTGNTKTRKGTAEPDTASHPPEP